MSGGVVAKAEQIKWWDVLDVLEHILSLGKGVQMARECQHPDAQWLAALFPTGVEVTEERFRAAMREQGDDPRALYMLWLRGFVDRAALARAAEMGYARAQTSLSMKLEDEDADLAAAYCQKGAAQGDPFCVFRFANCLPQGRGFAKDEAKALELFRAAAEWDYPPALFGVGRLVFGEFDWERYYWWGRAGERGSGRTGHGQIFCDAVERLLPRFERGELGRILHTAGRVIRKNFAVEEGLLFGFRYPGARVRTTQRVVQLYDEMMQRARRAIDCWSIMGRRCRVVKDIRVMIAKMAWEEAWHWGESEQAKEPELKAANVRAREADDEH
jgi:hypothetical protein